MDLNRFRQNEKFLMLALDHRGSFKKLINPDDADSVSDQQAINLKSEIISALKDQFSGLLIDADYGLPAVKQIGGVEQPYLLPMEKSGYQDEGGERLTEIGYSVEQLQELGAGGAKLLIYFNPQSATASRQLQTAKQVFDECKLSAFPLFLELVSYGQVDEDVVVQSVQTFLDQDIRPDVFKLEYPGSLEQCQTVTERLGQTPWIMLTKGDSYDRFLANLKVAAQAGCQGFLAGRALWQEVCQLEGEVKEKFLNETLPNRFKEISDVLLD